jgi:hypothetical protein
LVIGFSYVPIEMDIIGIIVTIVGIYDWDPPVFFQAWLGNLRASGISVGKSSMGTYLLGPCVKQWAEFIKA